MKSSYKRLGPYIRQVDVRNRDLRVTNLLGVSIDKIFIPSIANIIGTDLSTYKIVKKGQFAYGPVTSRNGDKVSIALLTEPECIISSSYTAFEIIDKEQLDPEYLMLWFSRTEFDRYARYMSHGSVREIFDWDEMCRVELPIPSIAAQRQLVKQINVLRQRIQTNEQEMAQMEKSIQCYFDEKCLNEKQKTTVFGEYVNFGLVRPLSKGVVAKCYEMSKLPKSGPIMSPPDMKPYNGGCRFKNGDTLIARISPCFENGKSAYVNVLNENEVAFGSTEYIVITPKEGIPASFPYFVVRNKKFRAFAGQFLNGSTGRQRIAGADISSFKMVPVKREVLSSFGALGDTAMNFFRLESKENEMLCAICNSLIYHMQ